MAQPPLLQEEGNNVSRIHSHLRSAAKPQPKRALTAETQRNFINLLVGCCHRFRRFLKTEYDALIAFSQQRNMEVDEQSQLPSAKLHVAVPLCLVGRQQCMD